MSTRLTDFLISLTNIVLSVIAFFLGLRIILEFIAANGATLVVAWIYSVSDGLVRPFAGIAPNPSIGVGFLDVVALIALIAYGLIGYLLIEVFKRLSLLSEDEYAHSTTHYHNIEEEEEETPRRHYSK